MFIELVYKPSVTYTNQIFNIEAISHLSSYKTLPDENGKYLVYMFIDNTNYKIAFETEEDRAFFINYILEYQSGSNRGCCCNQNKKQFNVVSITEGA